MAVHICVLILTVWYVFTFKIKRSLCFYISILITKVLISVMLVVELEMALDQDTVSVQEEAVSNAMTIFVYSLAAFFCLHYLVTSCWNTCRSLGMFFQRRCIVKVV